MCFTGQPSGSNHNIRAGTSAAGIVLVSLPKIGPRKRIPLVERSPPIIARLVAGFWVNQRINLIAGDVATEVFSHDGPGHDRIITHVLDTRVICVVRRHMRSNDNIRRVP